VLISYAHEPAARDQVLELSGSLRRAGIAALYDAPSSEILNPTEWMSSEIEAADFILCVGSHLYLSRWREGSRRRHSFFARRHEEVL